MNSDEAMTMVDAVCVAMFPGGGKQDHQAAATVIQQAFAERDGEIAAWLRDRSEAVFDAGYHDKALALDDAADAIEAGEHRQALAAKGDSRG